MYVLTNEWMDYVAFHRKVRCRIEVVSIVILVRCASYMEVMFTAKVVRTHADGRIGFECCS